MRAAGANLPDREAWLRRFLLVKLRRKELALRCDLGRLDQRALRLDDLVHHAFAESKATSDIRWAYAHLAQFEDLLFFNFCESENRLNHERRHCAYSTGTCAGAESEK